MQDFKMLIGGEERAAVGGEWTESINPYTGKVWARVPRGRADDAAFSDPDTRLRPRPGRRAVIRPPASRPARALNVIPRLLLTRPPRRSQ